MTSPLPTAIFLMGPTASGKTELSVQLAQELGAEIISVDSAMVYGGMDIGTAKPTMEERQNIPHHLIDILDPLDSFSTGSFRTLALKLMDDITLRGKVPLLTGGTMLYFYTLCNGLAVLPEADVEIRQKLNEEFTLHGNAVMHERLKEIDSESASKIHPNDSQRMQRALEVYLLTGKPVSQFFHEAGQYQLPYNIIKLIVAPEDRQLLHDKIAQRFRLMVEQGLIEEVEALFQRGDLNESLSSIRAVGYRQVWSYLKGECDKETMIEKGIIATRQLAKRQFTWLRKEQDALQFVSNEPDLTKKTLQWIKSLR